MLTYTVNLISVYILYAVNTALNSKKIDEELFEACLNLDVSHVKDIIDKGASPSTLLCRAEAASTLHLVCGILGCLDILQKLISSSEGCNFELRDKNGWTPLHHAASHGQHSIILYLITELKCDPMQRTNKGETLLHLACQKNLHLPNKVEIIKFLANDAYCDVNATNTCHETPLMLACMCRNSQMIVKCLVYDCHCCLSVKNKEGNTALHLACLTKNVDTVRLLLDATNCDIDMKNNDGFSPFLIACCKDAYSMENRVIDVLKLLSDAKCNVNVTTTKGETAIMLLCKWVQVKCDELTEYLVNSCSCDLSATDQNGNTALHIACTENNANFVEALVKEEACANIMRIKNVHGNTPLHLACSQNNISIVSPMLSISKKELYTVNNSLCYPFQLCIPKYMNNPELCRLIVSSMSKEYDKDNNGPLHIACRINDVQMLKIASEVGCDPNLANADGDTPLHLACKLGNLELTCKLLEMKCDIKIHNKHGEDPLMIALKQDYLSIVECLIQNIPIAILSSEVKRLLADGLDPHFLSAIRFSCSKTVFHLLCGVAGDLSALKLFSNTLYMLQSRDDQDLTPLHYACYFGRVEIVKYLISECLCDPFLKNVKKETPLHLACLSSVKEDNICEIVKFLINIAKCDYNEINDEGYSPLMLLLKMANPKNSVAKYLIIQCGCNLSLKSFCGQTPLHLACTMGNTEVIKLILEAAHLDFDVQDKMGFTPLQLACKHKHRDIVNVLFKTKSYNIHTILGLLELATEDEGIVNDLVSAMKTMKDDVGNNALHIVCSTGNIMLGSVLMKMKCFLTNVNNEGDLPLHIACRDGSNELVRLLCTNEYDVSARNNEGDTPLTVAGRRGDLCIIESLLQVSSKINDIISCIKQLNDEGVDLSVFLEMVLSQVGDFLHNICGQIGDIDTVRIVIAQSFNYHHYLIKEDEIKQTPLHYACEFGNIDIVTCIATETKFNPEIRNGNGQTLLHSACKSICDEEMALAMVQFLTITCESDCNAICFKGFTPLMLLLDHSPCKMTIVKYIIKECRCNLSLINHDGNSALHIASMNGNLEAVQLILIQSHYVTNSDIQMEHSKDFDSEAKVDDDSLVSCGLHVLNEEQLLPLTVSALNNHFEVVSLLVLVMNKHRDSCGNTPLHIACKAQNLYLAKAIIRMKLTTTEIATATNIDGDTPFHCACRCDDSYLMRLFLDLKYIVMDQNKHGNTPLHIACKNGSENAVQVILKVSEYKQCKNDDGQTPLDIAFLYNHLHIASLLITGHRLDEVKFHSKTLAKVKELILEGFNPDQLLQLKFKKSITFVHIACGRAGDIEAVKLLVKADKSHNYTKDGNGWTSLHYACFHGQLSITQYLICELGVNASAKGSKCITPLQLACDSKCTEEVSLNMVKFLVTTGSCDPNTKIYSGDTLLIYLLRNKCNKPSILQYLISEHCCDLLAKSFNGNTALHFASRKETSNLKVIELIANRDIDNSKILSYAMMKNNANNTPLHEACCTAVDTDIVKRILQLFRGKCGLYERNFFIWTPLECALKFDRGLAVLLIKHMFLDPDRNGNTPLHTACQMEDISMLKVILDSQTEMFFDTLNKEGDMAIHIACKTANLELIELLLTLGGKGYDGTIINIDAKNSSGDTPLHVACRNRNFKIGRLLMLKQCDVNVRDAYGNTALHLACNYCEVGLSRLLIERTSDINLQNSDGDTPLLLACKQCQFDIIKLLLNNPHIQISVTNNDGDTILHAVCRSPLCSAKVLLYVLEITNFNPNVRNACGMTPIQLTNYQGVIQELIRFGAHPMEADAYSNSTQLDIKHPPQPVTKVFIVGNSSVGKSTLTAALQKEASRLGKIFTPTKKVSGVEQKTAGIIPHEFDSKKYGQVTLYDFAGHREYYGSHAALLENSIVFSPPIFLLVVDLRDEYDDFKQNLYYWLSFLENQCNCVKPPVIIVGSHADILKSQGRSYDEKDSLIQHVQSSDTFTGVDIIGFVAMDCQYSQSDGMNRLRHLLKERCRKFRSLFTEKIRFNAQCLLDYISGKFKECRAITFETILRSIHDEREITTESNPLFCLPANFQTLYDLCYDLNDRGHILLLRDTHQPLKTWVVIDKESLLTEVNGTIFAPEGLRQYSNLASSTGVVPLNRLIQKFPNYSPTMLVGFLTHLEYCHEISDEDTLALIGEQVGKSGDKTYLFFPALVKAEAPCSIWTSKPSFTNHCGWVLKCEKPEQFFTSRFLEVLILRLAFSYALETASDGVGDHEDDVPVIQRKCTVWKSGIFWGNSDGIEIIVEFFQDNKTVMMAMRCSDKTEKLAFVHLRACVIYKILTAASNFCAKVKTVEYFLDPFNIHVYPIQDKPLTFINAKDIANLIVKTNTADSRFVVSEAGESFPITEILLFEPYILVHPQILTKLFDCCRAKSEEIPDWVLNSLAENLSKSENTITLNFAKMFDSSVCSPPTSSQLPQILKTWRKSCRGKCTYENLYQQLDKYSIYTKRNLLVSDSIVINTMTLLKFTLNIL